ncbi:MAG: hypothetical protein R2874_15315 [Desulfobacterales bacterium]
MKTINEKIPNPQEIEKEISKFLSEKYGDQVKMISPVMMPLTDHLDAEGTDKQKRGCVHFDLNPKN